MQRETSIRYTPPITFTGLLAVLFIGLKLAGVGQIAHWSWLWVLSPLWIPLGIGILITLVVILIAMIADR